MDSKEEARYRLKLSKGFLKEAKQDFELSRWRSCIDNAQLSVENAGRSIIAIYEPVEKTHEITVQLERLIKDKKIPSPLVKILESSLQLFGQLGWEEHLKVSYGEEISFRDPWQLFSESEAKEALEIAKGCFRIANRCYKFLLQKEK